MREKNKKIYAFIDSQNLNLGVKKDIKRGKRYFYKGWKLDFKRFFVYLTHKFRISKALLFIGYIKENEKLYQDLRSYGYTLVFKPTTNDGRGSVKGNVDAELVLHAAKIEHPNYDQAVFVSGDGDFYCLYKELQKDKKLYRIVIPNTRSESRLLSEFNRFKVFLQRDRKKIEKQ